ncbi:MAG: pyruvate kinase, partial [Armatimonadetes bacterium]|nr:pyruvate kinase [Armatimonadota bacterium]
MITYNPTKIICTLGPGSSDEETLRRMLSAGMDVARLNFSHGTHEEHAEVFARFRGVAEGLGCHVGVIADLQGPKIRTGELAGEKAVELVAGSQIVISTEACAGTAECVSTTYQSLPQDVSPGARVLLDDGRLELRVKSKTRTSVACEVVVGGMLDEHKGINLPGANVSAPSCTEKDREDLGFALDLG